MISAPASRKRSIVPRWPSITAAASSASATSAVAAGYAGAGSAAATSAGSGKTAGPSGTHPAPAMTGSAIGAAGGGPASCPFACCATGRRSRSAACSSSRIMGQLVASETSILGPVSGELDGVRQSTSSARRSENSCSRSTAAPCTASIATRWLSWVMPERRCTSEATAQNGRPRRMSSMKAVRLPRGPTSTKTRAPPSCSASMVSRKRTGLVQCSTSSSRICAGSSGYGAAVVQDQSGVCGALTGSSAKTPRRSSAKGANAGVCTARS